ATVLLPWARVLPPHLLLSRPRLRSLLPRRLLSRRFAACVRAVSLLLGWILRLGLSSVADARGLRLGMGRTSVVRLLRLLLCTVPRLCERRRVAHRLHDLERSAGRLRRRTCCGSRRDSSCRRCRRSSADTADEGPHRQGSRGRSRDRKP